MKLSSKYLFIGNLGWLGTSQLVRAAASFFVLLKAGEFLSPKEFGYYAILAAIFQVLAIISELGVTTIIMSSSKSNEQVFRSVYLVHSKLVLALMTCVVLCGLVFFYSGVLELKVIDLIILFFAAMFSYNYKIFRALIVKESQFNRLAKSEIAGSLIALIVTLICLIYGLKASALLINILVINFMGMLILFPRLSYFKNFSTQGLKIYREIGAPQMAANSLDVIAKELDVFIAAAVLDPQLHGTYTYLRSWFLKVYQFVVSPFQTLVIPLMTERAGMLIEFRNIAVAGIKVIGSSVSVVMTILIIVAYYLSEELHFRNYPISLEMIRYLGAMYILNSVGSMSSVITMSLGKPLVMLKWTVIRLSLLILFWMILEVVGGEFFLECLIVLSLISNLIINNIFYRRLVGLTYSEILRSNLMVYLSFSICLPLPFFENYGMIFHVFFVLVLSYLLLANIKKMMLLKTESIIV